MCSQDSAFLLSLHILSCLGQQKSVGCRESCKEIESTLFTCGEADRSSRGKLVLVLSSFLLSAIWSKKNKTVQTNMEAYVVWAINLKTDFRIDLRVCLEAVLASKPHFLN